MPRDSFFVDVMRKSPLIGVCLFVGLLLGGGYGIYATARGFEEGIGLRFLLMVIFVFILGGGFLGLVVGVIADTFVGKFRGDDKKQQRRRQRDPGEEAEDDVRLPRPVSPRRPWER